MCPVSGWPGKQVRKQQGQICAPQVPPFAAHPLEGCSWPKQGPDLCPWPLWQCSRSSDLLRARPGFSRALEGCPGLRVLFNSLHPCTGLSWRLQRNVQPVVLPSSPRPSFCTGAQGAHTLPLPSWSTTAVLSLLATLQTVVDSSPHPGLAAPPSSGGSLEAFSILNYICDIWG